MAVQSTQASVLIAIVWHAGTDFWGPLILTDVSIAAGPGSDVEIGGALYTAPMVVLMAVAVGIALATRGKLGYLRPSA